MRRSAFVLGVVPMLLALDAVASSPAGASGTSDSRVTIGSPTTQFPRNKQNEPATAVALDATNPSVLVAGSNEEIDNAPCNASDCSFTPGVTSNGIYFSFDAGRTWTEPTYTGWSARTGTPALGPIGTVPWFYERGLVGDGDPALAFGPRPGSGGFSWANGSRLYYASLTSDFPGSTTINAVEGIAVSRTDNVRAASAGNKDAWMRPVIASHELQPFTFSDKEAIWADNAASSRFFGNVYACWTSYGNTHPDGSTDSPILLAHSADGGATWSDPVHLTNARSTTFTGPTGCAVRTDSKGNVYAFWFQDNAGSASQQLMARSADGGASFGDPEVAAHVTDVGKLDPVHVANSDPRFTFDGIAGARTWSALSVDIANGAPTGRDATDELVLTWPDGALGLNHEQALLRTSIDRGSHWSAPVAAQQSGDRPDFPAIGISPNGADVYLTYDAFLTPWRSDTTSARTMLGVVRHAAVGSAGNVRTFSTVHRGVSGDARGSSENNLCCEFLGDYNYVAASRTFGVAVWNDVRNAAVCSAMNAYRASLITTAPLPKPAPAVVCPPQFGNSDIFGGSFSP